MLVMIYKYLLEKRNLIMVNKIIIHNQNNYNHNHNNRNNNKKKKKMKDLK